MIADLDMSGRSAMVLSEGVAGFEREWLLSAAGACMHVLVRAGFRLLVIVPAC